ncbi:MAG: dUTP diphosphatase [Candidatus Cloacimonadaceae bacterium]|jgi:dUTP pyrophosphatase|nr:dUTP diphosphatase [Candidatus Cloacimonadota bacterium]MDY0127832.1 dUTP diphosphatase [Candidatus Cloacimonadaceae bacterium]MCB5254080.1 dUTP diphosphatase [Candidatus Cloacimonadota bacterium]MCK9178200.1 dUTP diphosphatase [Candidatus Cloacimonadota bacterium]MCK9242598.1 dUTP diphosphatase [Candidatus Cloacimonadota bacterium]
MKIDFIKLHPAAQPPQQMSAGAAGYDLFACLDEDISLDIGQRIAIPTGLAISLPQGYEAQIRPRSGLALKLGLGVLNSPGTIDSDYRGEIKVILINLGTEPIAISSGMRIAQMAFCKVEHMIFVESTNLDETKRAEGGFGHSGH